MNMCVVRVSELPWIEGCEAGARHVLQTNPCIKPGAVRGGGFSRRAGGAVEPRGRHRFSGARRRSARLGHE